MKKLIKKIKEIFTKPSYDKEEVLQLIMLEASSFQPDLTDECRENFCKRIPYRGGYIHLDIDTRVKVLSDYLSVYNDPTDEPSYSVHVFDFSIELWNKHQALIEHDITVDEIRKALSFIEIYN